MPRTVPRHKTQKKKKKKTTATQPSERSTPNKWCTCAHPSSIIPPHIMNSCAFVCCFFLICVLFFVAPAVVFSPRYFCGCFLSESVTPAITPTQFSFFCLFLLTWLLLRFG
eukprot:m.306050 g.306050  ORF g.306050 m.306050 type:complete len:111 (-) comp18466_c0_seq1:22-354(-)